MSTSRNEGTGHQILELVAALRYRQFSVRLDLLVNSFMKDQRKTTVLSKFLFCERQY